jgi:hypothetical protein
MGVVVYMVSVEYMGLEEATLREVAVAKEALLREVAKDATLRESVLAMKSCEAVEAMTPENSDEE